MNRDPLHMSLPEAFAYFTECQLATLETLKSRKRTSNSELTRQQSIADKMVAVCHAAGISALRCPRLTDRLIDAAAVEARS